MTDREAAIRERYGTLRESEIELLAELAAAREQLEWHKATKQALMDAHEAAVRREAKLREALRLEADRLEMASDVNWTNSFVTRLRTLADGEGEADDGVYGDWRDNPGNYGE